MSMILYNQVVYLSLYNSSMQVSVQLVVYLSLYNSSMQVYNSSVQVSVQMVCVFEYLQQQCANVCITGLCI